MRTQTVMESINVVIDDTDDFAKYSHELEITQLGSQIVCPSDIIDEGSSDETEKSTPDQSATNLETTIESPKEKTHFQHQPSSRVINNHPIENAIGGFQASMVTRCRLNNNIACSFYISKVEPKNVKEALNEQVWINAMHEKLEGVAQGYTPVEGVYFDEMFAPVAWLESIQPMLAIVCYLSIKLFQMNVKSAIRNGFLNEEVFLEQPKGFEDPQHPDHVYNLKKALYSIGSVKLREHGMNDFPHIFSTKDTSEDVPT